MNSFHLLQKYNIKYESQCRNAGDSMPLGGHDMGCNVWVENSELYVYMAQSGAFDEAGNMVKAGRLKVCLKPNPFEDAFSQELRLQSGDIKIVGKSGEVETTILLWVDVKYGILHLEISSAKEHEISVFYENWRNTVNGYTNPDTVEYEDGKLVFYHKNEGETHFQDHIRQEGLEEIRNEFPDVQKGLVFGGCVCATGMKYNGRQDSGYAKLPCDSYGLSTKDTSAHITAAVHISDRGSSKQWKEELEHLLVEEKTDNNRKQETRIWWEQFWQRSYVHICPNTMNRDDETWQMGRNYQLFRYMLACNAYGSFPTKFNGGLFTTDPAIWGSRYGAENPDERDWGGIIFTAQNQRHVYWPMLKNGDADMMKPQFDFYLRLLDGAKARTSFFFGTENAACIPEQTDANGLSAYYGLYGLDYPMHVRYHYVTSVEFGYMMLKYIDYTNETEIEPYIEFIAAIINFYDQKYKKKDEYGKRIIFPSTAQETYHKADIIDIWGEEGRYAANYNEDEVAVTNPADVIFALHAVLKELLEKGYGDKDQRELWMTLKDELPPIPTEIKKGHKVIAPCEEPKNYVKTNCEFPQLYAVYPYHEIGIGETNNRDLDLAIDTYWYGWDEEDQQMNLSWMYVGILAARLGLTEEALSYQVDKMKDSGRRFPAFWGPGHDYTPDHNWGGCGMSGLQEMLLQNFDGKIYLLPAWPKNLDVEYKLWVEGNTYVEVSYLNGELNYTISDKTREKDVVV